jgi:hypothetical protein
VTLTREQQLAFETAVRAADLDGAQAILDQALASLAPEGKPVAWRWRWKGYQTWNFCEEKTPFTDREFEPLFAHPARQEGWISTRVSANEYVCAEPPCWLLLRDGDHRWTKYWAGYGYPATSTKVEIIAYYKTPLPPPPPPTGSQNTGGADV